MFFMQQYNILEKIQFSEKGENSLIQALFD